MSSDRKSSSPIISDSPYTEKFTPTPTARVIAFPGGATVWLPPAVRVTAILSLARSAMPPEEVVSPLVRHKVDKIGDLPADVYGDTFWMHLPDASVLAVSTVGNEEDEWRTVVHLMRTLRDFPEHSSALEILEAMAEADSAHAKLAMIGLQMTAGQGRLEELLSVCEDVLDLCSSPCARANAEKTIAEIRLLQGAAEAGEWHERNQRAAMIGDPVAMFNLAHHYADEQSDLLDGSDERDAAAALYGQATMRGCLQSLTNFALMLWDIGFDEERQRQGAWLLQHASRLGDEVAARALKRLDPHGARFGLDPVLERRILEGDETYLHCWTSESEHAA